MAFKNKDRNYQIRGVPDDVPGVSYFTGPKGWMDRTEMLKWFLESHIIYEIPNQRRILYVENCSGPTSTADLQEECKKINAEIRFFPPTRPTSDSPFVLNARPAIIIAFLGKVSPSASRWLFNSRTERAARRKKNDFLGLWKFPEVYFQRPLLIKSILLLSQCVSQALFTF